MSGESILGTVMMVICCFGSGILFFCLGIYAQRSEKPFAFWAGKEVHADWISDISGYNRENGDMWKVYSIPYFLAGLLSLFSSMHDVFSMISLIVLIFAAFPGIFVLIRHYRKIEKKYITMKGLDKINPFC